MQTPSDDAMIQKAVELAENWQKQANKLLKPWEKKHQRQMMRLIRDPKDKVILTKMIDQSFRSGSNARIADQVNFVLKAFGVPGFFSFKDQSLMRAFLLAGRHAPNVSVPKMVEKIREDSARSVIPGEREPLMIHLRKRRKEGVRMNINHLGEAVLGEDESLHRLKTYIEDLHDPEIEYISVKISTIYSQISALAFEHTLSVLMKRLTLLYRAAQENRYVHADGVEAPKFVNLDMEEYRDLEITAEAFVRTLDQPEFKTHTAGIVLQAYLPDSFEMQRRLTDWARKRVAEGGAPVKIRLVKGANMEMELVEAAIRDWPLAPYDNKLAVDANFKRMVDFGVRSENAAAVHLGIGSHNLFDQAYAYLSAHQAGVLPSVSFEMLEGMANHVWRAIRKNTGEPVVLYAPVATREEFINAIAYLIRRLDENTAEDNFLRYSFNLKSDSPEWEKLKKGFIAACRYKDAVPALPNRIQNRNTETFPDDTGAFHRGEFTNEPDTDWSLKANREWAEAIREKWRKTSDAMPEEIPVVIAGEEILEGRNLKNGFDPNALPAKIAVARFALASEEDVHRAVAAAKADPDGWRGMDHAARHTVLSRVAMELRRARGDLIGAAAANTGKVFTESDPEVSEAVDFAEFYPFSAGKLHRIPGIRVKGKGVGVVISPWNFPIAIPCGGIMASLAAGNTVIFKPASAAVLTAWHICQCFWRGGVSKNTLQFVPCDGSAVGSHLTRHPDVDYVILTGGTDTGMAILKSRPGVSLAAETGGKNATIVTAMADRDQAIKNVLHSAFSNSGQKCSATSLLILEKEVFEDERFRKQLVDAASSYATGSAWRFRHRMGSLVASPSGVLEKALTTLEPGEEWALEPRNIDGNPLLWTPGIKWNVQPGGFTHLTEFFGPVLGVMRADNLKHAIALVNQTGYGLTSGLESLDPREHEIWKAGVEAGNLYINRGTTGAVVLRQPFGGMKKSALGAGIKAGSPNYVSQFMEFEQAGWPEIGAIRTEHRLLRLACEWHRKLDWGQFSGDVSENIRKTVRAIKSYLYHAETEFRQEKDYFHIRGEDNVMRYLPIKTLLVRVHPDDTLFEALARIAAAKVAGCDVIVGLPKDLENPVAEFLTSPEGRKFLGKTRLTRHTDDELIESLAHLDRIRYAAPNRVPPKVFEAAAKTGFYIARSPVLMEGRLELLHYFREQSVSHSYHRYGNLGERALLAD